MSKRLYFLISIVLLLGLSSMVLAEPIDDQVDFRDYAILSDNWLTEQLWP